MISAFWAAKGGVGVTASVIGLAASVSRSQPVTIVDLAGDMEIALGISAEPRDGIFDWLNVADDVGAERLRDLQIPIRGNLSLLPRGKSPHIRDVLSARARLFEGLNMFESPLIDVGTISSNFQEEIARSAPQSLLVIPACYLSMQHAVKLSFRPHGLVFMEDSWRPLHRRDVESALGVSAKLAIPHDVNVARSLDAGVLHLRPPRFFDRAAKALQIEELAA